MAIDFETAQPAPLATSVGPRVRSAGRALPVLIAITAAATWLLTGVSAADAARFVVFEALYVLVPGCMLCALLSARPRDVLRILAVGWPLGYAIEMAAFAATAALGQRELLAYLPVVAVATMGPPLLRVYGCPSVRTAQALLRRIARGPAAGRAGLPYAVAGCAVAAGMIVLALEFFTRYPLPGHAASFVYQPDNVFDISLAVEALHHWPILQPYTAGRALHYYTGFFVYAAAVTQVIGVAPATIVMRLFPTTIFLLTALQLWLLGREMGHSPWTGTLAVCIFFPITDVSLNAAKFRAFPPTPFYQITLSPTYAFGVAFFLALLLLAQRRLTPVAVAAEPSQAARGPSRPASRPSRSARGRFRSGDLGSLVMVAILVLACAVVKTPASFTFLGGLGLFWLWRVVRARDGRLWSYLAVSAVGTVAVYRLLLVGGIGSSSLRIQPLAFVQYTLFVTAFPAHTAVQYCVLVCAAVIVYLVFLVPSSGALWLLRRRELNTPFVGLCVAVFATGFAVLTFVRLPSVGQGWFQAYAWIAIMPVAALGLTLMWRETPRAARARIARACLAMLALGLVVAGSMRVLIIAAKALGWERVERDNAVLALWFVAAYGLVAVAVTLYSRRLAHYYTPAIRSRAWRTAACVIPMLLALGLVRSIGVAVNGLWGTVRGRQVIADSREDPGMTASLYAGLLWVRAHTAPCDVLAVNFHATSKDDGSLYFYYSAFAEREVFLESWSYSYTAAAEVGGQPFPGKLALNDLAVNDGDPAALRALARDGVSYVLVDKHHGHGANEPAAVSTLVFSNQALDVYRLRTPPPQTVRPRCAERTESTA